MKKKLLWFLATLVLLVGVVAFLVFRNVGKYGIEAAIPDGSVAVIQMPSFENIHEKLNNNRIWAYLKNYPYFAEYHKQINYLDSISLKHSVLRKLLIDRPFSLSCHLLKNGDYDFLYVCDLGKLNVLDIIDNAVLATFGKVENDGKIVSFSYDGNTFYYSIEANLLILSQIKSIVSESVSKCKTSTTNSHITFDADLNVDINYPQLMRLGDPYFSDNPVVSEADMSVPLKNSSLSLKLGDKDLEFSGTTLPQEESSFMKALNNVGDGKSTIYNVTGDDAAGFVSLCFDSFEVLKDSMLHYVSTSYKEDYDEYNKYVERIGRYLRIDILKAVTSWIGNEIALIKPSSENKNLTAVFAFQYNDLDYEKLMLDILCDRIEKTTTIKMNDMEFNGHIIKYLGLKGVFKPLIGQFFNSLTRPYFTIVDKYVLFSDSPESLIWAIKKYTLGQTLANSEKYSNVISKLDKDVNVLVYVDNAEFFEALVSTMNPPLKDEFVRNREAFYSFENMGLSMDRDDGVFKTKIVAIHNAQAVEDVEIKRINKRLEWLVEDVELDLYKPEIPDTLTYRGEYTCSSMGLVYSGNLSNGKPDGLWTINTDYGVKLATLVYKYGVMDGDAHFYYPSGVVSAMVSYQENKIVAYREYYPDGATKAEIPFKKGHKDGEATFYYQKGSVSCDASYKKGKKNGTWKYYKVTGELDKKVRY